MGAEPPTREVPQMTWLRLFLVTLVAGMIGAGIVLGPQPQDVGPELPVAGDGPYLICPGAVAGGGFTGRLGLFAEDPAPGRLTVVSAGGASATIQPAGLGGAIASIGDLAELGATPLYVEASGQIAAATLAGAADAASLVGCVRGSPGPIAALGVATLGNESASLQLVNPFSHDASLRLALVSELGSDTPSDLESLRLPAATHLEIGLGQLLTGREAVSIEVEALTGLVAMSVVRAGATDVAAVEALPGSLEWHIPIFSEAQAGKLHIRSLSDVVGDYRVDRIDQTGTLESVAEATLNPGEQVVLSVADLGASQGGLAVVGTEPLVTALVIEDGHRRAIANGGVLASRWVVPVSGTGLEGQNHIWIFNPGDAPLVAGFARLDGAGPVTSLEVAPGATVDVPYGDIGGGGMLVESDGLMVVFYGVVSGDAIGLSVATALG